jgi:Na+-driven multidrug efflux pump
VNTLIFVFQVTILCFAREILLEFRIQEELISLSQTYIYFSLPGMYFKIQFETTRCYLEGQKIIGITSRIIIPCCFLHALICYILIVDFDKGIEGVAISNTIIFAINFVILWWYLSKRRFKLLHPNAWHFINKDAFKNWGEYIKNGWIPSSMMFIDNLTFQCLVIFMSWLGKPELAAYCLVITTVKFTFILPSALNMVAYHLVGNALALNRPKKAMKYSHISIAFGFICGIIFGLIYLFFGELIADSMTVHEPVQEKFRKLVPFLALQ